MATPKQTDPQFKLRLTHDLRDRIEAAALEHNRSMNAEIVHRLEAYDFQRLRLSEQVAALQAAELEKVETIRMAEKRLKGWQEELRVRVQELADVRRELSDLRTKLAYQEGMSASLQANLEVFIKHLASPESDAKALLDRIVEDIRGLKPPKGKSAK